MLLDADGKPKVTDFGLAKKLDTEGMTQTGAVMGTPPYMAPEQAAGRTRELGPAVDVYALGAILYELLTGRPPFQGESNMSTLLQVIRDDPVPPSRLRPKLPRDLETICLKCLAKDQRHRYAAAGDLAADLGRFIAGEPVKARATRRWERTIMWARRYPARATVAILCLALVAATGAGVVVSWFLANAVQQSGRAEKGEAAAQDAKDEIARNLYMDRVALAWKQWEAGNHIQSAELLASCEEKHRNWEWHHLSLKSPLTQTLVGHKGSVMHLSFSPDGKRLASASKDQTVILWDVSSGKILATLRKP